MDYYNYYKSALEKISCNNCNKVKIGLLRSK